MNINWKIVAIVLLLTNAVAFSALLSQNKPTQQYLEQNYPIPQGRGYPEDPYISPQPETINPTVAVETEGQDEIVRNNTPRPAWLKYQEMIQKFGHSLGAGIQLCSKGSEQIYAVYGSGGYTGETYFYTTDGSFVGVHAISDTCNLNNPSARPPVNLQEYTCLTIEQYKGDSAPRGRG